MAHRTSASVISLETKALPRLLVRTNRMDPASNFLSLRRAFIRASSGNFLWQLSWQIKRAQSSAHLFRLVKGEAGFLDGEGECRGDAKAHRFAMKVPSVACGIFDRMANRVPKVEQGPQTGFLEFILGDDLRLDLLISRDQTDRIGVDRHRQIGKHGGVSNDRVFHYFGDPFVKLPVWQAREQRRICNDLNRLVKGADQVFPFACVYSCFAPDCAVDLGDHGRRYLHMWDSSVINRSDESG